MSFQEPDRDRRTQEAIERAIRLADRITQAYNLDIDIRDKLQNMEDDFDYNEEYLCLEPSARDHLPNATLRILTGRIRKPGSGGGHRAREAGCRGGVFRILAGGRIGQALETMPRPSHRTSCPCRESPPSDLSAAVRPFQSGYHRPSIYRVESLAFPTCVCRWPEVGLMA